MMPRSLARLCAETALTSCSMGRSRPAIAAELSALRIHLSDNALIGYLHPLDAGLGKLAGKGAELFRQRHERLELRRLFGADRGEVDGIGDGAAGEIVRHLLGDLQRDVFLRLRGRGAEMRRADHVRQREQRIVGRRLGHEHVERRSGDAPRRQRLEQSRLVDQPAAGAIDQAQALFRQLQRFGVDDIAGLVGERGMQRDEVGAAQQLFEPDFLDAEVERPFGGEIGIVGNHPHLQPERAVGDDRADIAATDDAERLAENLHAEKFVLLPFAGAGRGVGLGDLPGQRQHQRDGMLGGGDRIAERRVHHDDAARRRRRDVDIVDADAGAADHFQLLRPLQYFCGDLGRGADRQPVEAVDCLGELVLVLAETGLEFDREPALLENRHGGG